MTLAQTLPVTFSVCLRCEKVTKYTKLLVLKSNFILNVFDFMLFCVSYDIRMF